MRGRRNLEGPEETRPGALGTEADEFGELRRRAPASHRRRQREASQRELGSPRIASFARTTSGGGSSMPYFVFMPDLRTRSLGSLRWGAPRRGSTAYWRRSRDS